MRSHSSYLTFIFFIHLTESLKIVYKLYLLDHCSFPLIKSKILSLCSRLRHRAVDFLCRVKNCFKSKLGNIFMIINRIMLQFILSSFALHIWSVFADNFSEIKLWIQAQGDLHYIGFTNIRFSLSRITDFENTRSSLTDTVDAILLLV